MVIEINDISKTFIIDKANPVKAVKGVSLRISQGEFVGIIGVSGSGKSTLLHMIGTLVKPSSGSIKYDDQDISTMTDKQIAEFRNRNIGFVFQDYALLSYKTVEENLEIPLLLSDANRKERKRVIEERLKSVNMTDYKRRRVRTLSGGQKQKVAIARSLIMDPSFILADEPTGALDQCSKKEIIELLKLINKRGKTVIVVTHDPQVVEECSRVIRMKDGELIE